MLSIIVPVYNSENYLQACIESIIGQTYTDLEIILVNDGSTDKSLEICHQFAADDERIKVLNHRHRGQSAARNHGLDCATGKYITFVDSDDELDVETYAGLVDYLEQNENIDVVQYPSVRNYGTKEGYVFKPAPEVISGTEAFYNKWIVENKISWIIWDKVYRRAVFEDLRFQHMHFEDNYLVAELLTRIKNLAIVDYGLYFYYKREGSITTSPHTFVKERDLQKVNLKIYDQLTCLKNVDAAKVKMQEIVLNCSLSLHRSYHQEFLVFSKNDINVWYLLWSAIKPKQKLKLLLFKIFGPQLFRDSFGTVSVDRMPTMLELEYFGERQ